MVEMQFEVVWTKRAGKYYSFYSKMHYVELSEG